MGPIGPAIEIKSLRLPNFKLFLLGWERVMDEMDGMDDMDSAVGFP